MRLFIFGPGYVGAAFGARMAARGWTIAATARHERGRAALAARGWAAVDPSRAGDTAADSDAVLVTAAPGEQGCPAFAALGPALAASAGPSWIGYLSSTGVYGDRHGRWVTEASALNAQSLSGARRVAAEGQWHGLARNLAVFRLPGIYGPGRSALDRLRAGTAQRIVRPGQVFSRIHLDDLTAALEASLKASLARPGGVFNLCDDEPAPPQDVIAHAASLLGIEPPPEIAFDEAQLAPESRRFFAESKRVSNAKAKAALGWRPAYPSYREGLRAILDGE